MSQLSDCGLAVLLCPIKKINYIHNNPVNDNFVSKPEHWLYSSASNYIEGKGILDVVFCLPPIQQTVR